MSVMLLIGEDECLLKTRAAVLRSTNAEILCADVNGAVALLHQRRFDVVVLCHSIQAHLSRTFASLIQQNWPETRILQISALRPSEESDVPEGVDLCSSDPECLIARSVDLLGRKGCGSVSTSSPALHRSGSY